MLAGESTSGDGTAPGAAHCGERAESLFGDTTFDTVVVTLSLCTIPDPDAAVRPSQ